MMQTIGRTLKQIRLAKGFTQKEIYQGIVSRSFAIRLESGHHDLGASKLFLILDRLGVSAGEFRFIQNDYQPDTATDLNSQIMLAYDQQNFPLLSHLAQRYQASDNPTEQRMAVMAATLLVAFDHEHVVLSPAMAHLWQQFTFTKTWTLQDLKMGPVLLALAGFKHEPLPAIIRRFHVTCERYVTATTDQFDVMDDRSSFDLVALQVLLVHQEYAAARAFRNQVEAGYLNHLSTDGALAQQLCLCIWSAYFGDFEQANDLASRLKTLPLSRYQPGIHSLLNSWLPRAKHYRQTQNS